MHPSATVVRTRAALQGVPDAWPHLAGAALLLLGMGAVPCPASADTTRLDDARIADVVVTVNDFAIEAGRLAQALSEREAVQDYARRLAEEHARIRKSTLELAGRLDFVPRAGPVSREFKADGAADLDRLRSLNGNAFDRAYIERKIVLYQNVLDTIDNRLMPNATSEELKALLYGLFSPFSLHLEDAQRIQEALDEPEGQPGTEDRAPG
jgi:putative membrane protein